VLTRWEPCVVRKTLQPFVYGRAGDPAGRVSARAPTLVHTGERTFPNPNRSLPELFLERESSGPP